MVRILIPFQKCMFIYGDIGEAVTKCKVACLYIWFSQAIMSCTPQKGPNCGYRFIIAVTVNIVTGAINVYHFTMLPQLSCLSSSLRRDNSMQLRVARHEQDGTLNARNDFAPVDIRNCCESRFQDIDIQFSF